MTEHFPVGKIPSEFVERLWQRYATPDPSVIVGPGIGRDVAVVDIGDGYLVAKSDPITFATDRIGWYAVHVNANDVACSGARPEWFLATLLLPEGRADEALVDSIFEEMTQACQSLGISLVGGHSEVTHGLDRPIVMGCLLGRVAREDLITTSGAQAGDAVLLAGGIPIEATAIIAREKGDELEGSFDSEFLARCRALLRDPGISVLPAAQRAVEAAPVHAMHDPTEGGLATGLWELAQASSCDLEIEAAAIPILPEGQALCDHFELDPLGAIASGALLLTAPAASVDAIETALAADSINFARIGRVLEGSGEVILRTDEGSRRLMPPPRDEIARLFG